MALHGHEGTRQGPGVTLSESLPDDSLKGGANEPGQVTMTDALIGLGKFLAATKQRRTRAPAPPSLAGIGIPGGRGGGGPLAGDISSVGTLGSFI